MDKRVTLAVMCVCAIAAPVAAQNARQNGGEHPAHAPAQGIQVGLPGIQVGRCFRPQGLLDIESGHREELMEVGSCMVRGGKLLKAKGKIVRDALQQGRPVGSTDPVQGLCLGEPFTDQKAVAQTCQGWNKAGPVQLLPQDQLALAVNG